MLYDGKIDVCVHKWDKTALYFKIPDRKYALGDSGYCEEPGKFVCVDDVHGDEIKQFMLWAKHRQEFYHSWLCGFCVLSHWFRHGNSTANINIMEYHQTCVNVMATLHLKFRSWNGLVLQCAWLPVYVWLRFVTLLEKSTSFNEGNKCWTCWKWDLIHFSKNYSSLLIERLLKVACIFAMIWMTHLYHNSVAIFMTLYYVCSY